MKDARRKLKDRPHWHLGEDPEPEPRDKTIEGPGLTLTLASRRVYLDEKTGEIVSEERFTYQKRSKTK